MINSLIEEINNKQNKDLFNEQLNKCFGFVISPNIKYTCSKNFKIFSSIFCIFSFSFLSIKIQIALFEK